MANKPEDYVDSSISALEFAAEALVDAYFIMADIENGDSAVKKSETEASTSTLYHETECKLYPR
jgi:hypothetical protein